MREKTKHKDLEFDSKIHRFFYRGVPIPSVTGVIGSVFGNNFNKNENAREFGRKLHKATALYDNHNLNMNSIDDDGVKPWFDQWNLFVKEHVREFVLIEEIVFSKKLQVAGILDRVAIMKDGCLALIDEKSGVVNETDPIQTAGYEILSKLKIQKRMSVYVKADKYTIQPHNSRTDRRAFLACCDLNFWKGAK